MLFSYNWLQSYFSKKLPKPEKLAELLTLHFAEVGEIKKNKQDFALDIDIRPNRASDCLAHIGIAEEVAAILSYKLKTPAFARRSLGEGELRKDSVAVEVRHKFSCPRYTALVVNNIKVGPSPKWLQERLEVCGLRPINNIVDIANYAMLETGQPLHAFDLRKLDGKKIIVRFAKQGEEIVTLDNQKFALDEEILVIADAKKSIAIAGIKGGKSPEIDKETGDIVLESANFNPQIIRQASKKLNLKTDASLRFEHGLDPNLTEIAVNRAAYLIKTLAQGKIAQVIDYYPKKVLPKMVKLDLGYAERLLGVKIPISEMKNILKRLGFQLIEAGPQSIEPQSMKIRVKVPTWRLDINIPEDLIEEIGRIYGYEKIKPQFPEALLIPPKRNEEIFWEDVVKNTLKEAGFSEARNYSFMGDREAQLFNYDDKDLIELENPLSNEQKYLRPSLIPNLLNNIKFNQDYSKTIKIFELGKIFQKLATEQKQLSGAMTGDAFYQAKGIVDLLLQKIGISDIWYDDYKPTPQESKISIWHLQKSAEIKIGGKEIGFLGEISPKIARDLKLESKVVVFDLDFEKLSELASEEREYSPISKFPASARDLAILVPSEIRMEEVLNKIEIAGGALVRDVDIFDIYEGEELPVGKKNLAFHIIYQSEDRTLTSKEIDEVHQKIIKILEEDPEWEVRK